MKPLNKDSGVSGLLRTALWLNSVCGLEVLSMGRSATGKEDCALEIVGSQLLVRIVIAGGWVWLSAGSFDEGEQPQPICNFGDGPQGWSDVRRLVAALERSGIKSLRDRPVKIGETGSLDCYVIA